MYNNFYKEIATTIKNFLLLTIIFSNFAFLSTSTALAASPTFTIVDSVSPTPTKTDTIRIGVIGSEVNATTIAYGFSADNTCDNNDTYDHGFVSGNNFDISENHTDYLCITAANNGGEISYQLVGKLNTDNTAPTNQDTVFTTSSTKNSGVSVTVVSAGETGGAIWFAPSGTTSFSAGPTMTTASGTATSILAPTTEGNYKLFVIDTAGNISSPSTATLTVNNTTPSAPVISSVAADNIINNTEAASVQVVGTAAADFSVSVTLTDTATPTPHTITATSTADGAGNYSVSLDATSLTDGNISVSAFTTNNLGVKSNTTTTTVQKDTIRPHIIIIETQDTNENGKIDAIKITFNKDINDATVLASNFDISGYSNEAFSSGDSSTFGDVVNNNIIYITFTEGNTYDTGNSPSVAYIGTLRDTSGNLLSAVALSAIDKAKPIVVVKQGDGLVDYQLPVYTGAADGVTFAEALSSHYLTFSEQLNNAGKTAVQNALQNGSSKSLSFTWATRTLFIFLTDTPTAIFANDVVGSGIIDIAENTSNGLLMIDSANTSTEVQPTDNSGNITLTNAKPQGVLLDPALPIIATVTAGTTAPEINVNSLINNGTGILPQINIVSNNAGNINVQIPASTTVTSADNAWNGVIAAPTLTTVTIPNTATETMTPSTAVSVGFSGAKLSFDKAVRILLPGQAGKRAGYIRTGISFTEITTTCVNDTQASNDSLPVDGDCKINVGSDLVIWTKHFTTFASYTGTTITSGGSGGGSVGTAASSFTANTNVSISINNGNSKTLSPDVVLTLNGGTTAKKMAIANGDNFTNVPQQDYATKIKWKLSEGQGIKKICAKFYDSNGYYSNTVCDEIAYGANTIPTPSFSDSERQELIRKILIMIIQKLLSAKGISL